MRCGWSPTAPLDARTILRRLVAADPEATAYLADLSPAGGGYAGTALVGASPELLVARSGDQVSCQPFAGSAPRSADPEIDAANGAALAASGKNRHEHQLVVDTMRAALEPLCTDLDVAPEPQLSRTAALWHLSTPIRGTLRENSTTAIDLALALHPDPGRRRRADRRSRRPDRRTRGRPRLLRRRGRAGATPAATAAGWCRSAAPSCPPTAAARWPRPAAASSPSPTPTTKSPRPQRSSGPSCRRWGCSSDRGSVWPGPATRPRSSR